MQHQDNYLLCLNARDKASGSNNYNPRFNLADMANMFHNKGAWVNFTLLSAEIPFAFYPISSARQNNKLTFTDNSGTYTITLDDNSYSGAQMAVELTTKMDAASARTYTITYDSQSKKFTIAPSAGTVSFATSTNGAEAELGIDVDQAASSSYVTAYPVALQGSSYIDLHITHVSHHNHSSGGHSPVYRIPLNASFGDILFYSASHEDGIRVNLHNVNEISCELRDDKGLLLDIPANHYPSFTFKLGFEYK